MSEPRKSLRATKGINPKIDSLDSPVAMDKKGTARKVTKKKVVEEEPDDADEVVRCVCGARADDGEEGETWIACDTCKVWQHNVCVGVSTFEDEIPDNYLCEQHDKVFHKELLQATARGEQIWVARREKWEKLQAEIASKKKGKKGGARKSNGGANGKSTAPSTPVPETKKSASGSVKRKDRDESHDKDTPKEPKHKVRKVTAPIQQQKTPPTEGQPSKIGDLESIRQGPATLIFRSLLHTIPTAVHDGVFQYLGDDTLESKAERLALQVEHAVYTTHPDRSSYKVQSRAIGANLKTNQDLTNGLLTKSLTPLAFAGMGPEDMISQARKEEDAALKARSDKQSILVSEEGPRIRRTHKGEEVIEQDNQMHASDTIMVAQPRRRSSNADMVKRSRENSPSDQVELPDIDEHTSHDDIRSHTVPKQGLNIDTKPTPARKASGQTDFNIDKIFSSVQSPVNAGNLPHGPRRASSHAAPPKPQGSDPEIDKLLQDDEGMDSPPYSPAEHDADPSVIWRGAIIMESIAEFPGTAKYVGGFDVTKKLTSVSWSDVMERNLRVAGRIELAKADEYLCSLRYSQLTDLAVVQVTPSGEEASRQFQVMYDYFHSKARYGVLANRGVGNIRDTYLVPVPPSPAPLPDFVVNLDEHSIPEKRDGPSLLVALVIRDQWQGDPSQLEAMMPMDTQSPAVPPHQAPHPTLAPPAQPGPVPTMSPIVPQNPSFGSSISSAPPAHNSQSLPQTPEVQGEDLARRILGSHVHDPTVKFLLPNANKMRPLEWEIIKRLLESDELCQTDLKYLCERLEEKLKLEGTKDPNAMDTA